VTQRIEISHESPATNNSHPVELVAFRDLSPRVRSFEIRFDVAESFVFQAGQFIAVEFSIDQQNYSRFYSICSPPGSKNSLEFLAKYNPGGPGTRFLWSTKPGSRFSLAGPFGIFQLRRPEPRASIFIATGTGIAPIRSMLGTILPVGEAPRMALVYGAREQADLLYHSEFVEWTRRNPKFSYSAVLSQPSNGWSGLRGYVQDHIATIVNASKPEDVYLSGLTAMVEDVRRILTPLGFKDDSIYCEKA
jgi:CDP-4-dehydro-6-deoxyglucose reductase